MKPTLLVLAAGMGSRYGSLKQLDQFGPSGETIIEYSVYDAIRAGFGKVVFVIRKAIEQEFKEHFHATLAGKIQVEYVYQELDKLPGGMSVPPDRVKPWGTAHALWVASSQIKEPFAVLNGDDFYGAQTFQVVADFLQDIPSLEESRCCLVGYPIMNTLSEHGAVARGICEVDKNNNLTSIVERTKIWKAEDGAVLFEEKDGTQGTLSGNEVVSMNFWGFTPAIFKYCESYLTQFLSQNSNNPAAEFYLPVLMNELVKSTKVEVKVIQTPENWFGVTYLPDKPIVIKEIEALVKDGVYPNNLWA